MAAHTLRGSWTLGAVACCSAAGAGPAEEEESWKQTRGDSSELTGGSCPREEKGLLKVRSRLEIVPGALATFRRQDGLHAVCGG